MRCYKRVNLVIEFLGAVFIDAPPLFPFCLLKWHSDVNFLPYDLFYDDRRSSWLCIYFHYDIIDMRISDIYLTD